GRGGGDYFRADVKDTSKLSISRSGGTDPRLYVSQDEYPALKISYQGYPPEYPNGNLTNDEIILDEGTYYISVYAPEVKDENLEGKPSEGHHLPMHGDPSLRGNYGKYELTLEKAESETPTSEPEPITEVDTDLTDDTVELDWEVPDDGGSRINYYLVYRDGEQIAKVVDSKYLDKGLEEDKNYDYHITAVNFIGESEKSEENMIPISTHEYPVYEENSVQFMVSITLLILWVGAYFGMKKMKGSSS
ncbi:MAG: fibronectin type III domain-containing protein, partial [Candidatus Thermoplasmatota archaeon]